MEISEFFVRYNARRKLYAGERPGQAAFNTAALIDPEATYLVANTSVDPFYQDKNMERFIQAVVPKLGENK